MKVQVSGKVLERTVHRVTKKDGTSYDLYSLIIEEAGMYPSIFKMSTKDASIFGQKDGPLAVGKLVTAYGFANGKKVTTYKDKTTGLDAALKVPRYDVYFNLTKLEPNELVEVAKPSEESDDMPF